MLEARQKPQFPRAGINGANPRQVTKFTVLSELRHDPLPVYALIERCDLTEWQIRMCLRGNTATGKRVPLVTLAGVMYDELSDRRVAVWGLTPEGRDWVDIHIAVDEDAN